MGNQHNDSMSEQGSWYQVDVVGSQSVKIPSGTTNVLVVGSSTANMTRFKTRERSGRKLRIAARSDSGDVIITSGQNINTVGSSITLEDGDSAEFVCTPNAAGVLIFTQTAHTNIVA